MQKHLACGFLSSNYDITFVQLFSYSFRLAGSVPVRLAGSVRCVYALLR